MDIMKVNKGDVVLFVEGKNGKPVGYSPLGKVVLCKHKIALGYATVKTVEERENYFLVTAEHVTKDYYDGISYKEFLEILPMHGFKIGYNITFEYDGHSESQIFAYNLENHSIIIAETWDNRKTFNSIDLYCPGMSCFKGWSKAPGFYMGSNTMCAFNLCHLYRTNAENILAFFMNKMNAVKKDNGAVWGKDTPNLWHYADVSEHLWDDTIRRILLVDPEIDTLFENCPRMKEILDERKKIA